MTSASIPNPQPAPFENRFIEAGGVRLNYLDYGAAGRTGGATTITAILMAI